YFIFRELFKMRKTNFNDDLENEEKHIPKKTLVLSEKNNWEQTKSQISKNMKEIVWKAWIEPLQFLEYKKQILYITANSSLISNRAETQYYETIFFEASRNFDNLKEFKILKINSLQQKKLLLKNNNIDLKLGLKPNSDISFIDSISIKLNPKFTFDNFVVGPSNQMPFAASKRVSENQTFSYNPLYIHGNVGMGKTHLLNAIAIELNKKYPNLKTAFMSAERFMYQFIKAIRSNNTIKFKDQFRSLDFLIIDDIQFMSGKESTQEEFFYTLNDLINQGKQIILSSNKSPVQLIDLDEKLRSRLGGGLVVDFLPTNFNLRMDILKKKVDLLKLDIPNDILEFLATKIESNIRELEGALNRIWANYELTGKNINLEHSKELLSDLLLLNDKKISINSIQQQVVSYFNLKFSDMTSTRRSISIARPRQIAMFLCKDITSFSYPEIGKEFGGKDHTTVIHAVKKIVSLSSKDVQLQNQLNSLKKIIISC
ncbi:chromosomal replication initiator protein DnaA, partial [Alphaproteobacteria bacterium]|nr:chromosomal replication initiator protein DnaA [Alphaproteobacteria bacterium]